MMDNWCAPQWTDFTRSPQLSSDSYFDVVHEELEPASLLKSRKYERQESKKAEVSSDSLEEDVSHEETPTPTPKVAFFVTLDKDEKIAEIEKLPEAMKNLQICAKARKPLTRSKIRKSINNTISGDCSMKYLEAPKRISFGMKQSPKEILNQGNKRLSYKIVRRRESTLFRSNRYSLGKNGPRVLTSQYNRRSLIKGRRRSNQFVSLAEAVSKFHSGTPDRFRTICSKDLKPAAIARLKKQPLKLTCPISPALRCNQRCKQRAKVNRVLTKEEREDQELEEMRKHQIKANPVPANILKAPIPLKKVEKKPNTITEEFKLTQPKTYRRTIMPLLNCKTKKEEKSTSSSSLQTLANIPKKETDPIEKPTRKYLRQTAGPILSPSKPLEKKEEHKTSSTSVATTSSGQSRVTRTIPFAFEARTKELLEKKEQKLKTLQSQELNKMKVEFHARPVPNFSKPTINPKEHPKKMVSCPFSFAERDKCVAKKKEQQMKQILDERDKPRQFHANPVPTFKPVAVHGLSKDNSRIRDKSVDRTKRLNRTNDQENKQPNIICNLNEKNTETDCNKSLGKKKMEVPKPKTAVELNTDKRAKDRQDFDEKLKKKEHELELKRLEEERQRIETEKKERAELRKKTEVKARPMPLYKPLQILRSTKPPTSPKSPAWSGKLKSKNIP